jgi:hypothetical protein
MSGCSPDVPGLFRKKGAIFSSLFYYFCRMTLRPARNEDWKILLQWRNDEDTRRNSHNMDEVSADNHKKWLHSVLNNPNRKLFVAVDKIPVGTIRADFDNGV